MMASGGERQGSTRATGSQAIERALSVLECFISSDPELGISEIARRLKLTPSTVHRIVRALTAAGYLEQNSATERYYLGRSAVLLGQIAERSTGLGMAYPVIERVATITSEATNLGIRDGDVAVVALRAESAHALRFEQPVGTHVHLHASAMGKALLAFAVDRTDVLRRLRRLQRFTEHTISSRAALEAELARTRERGYSLDEQETQLGVRCIGAPVLDASGQAYAAVGIQIPTVRMPQDRMIELAPLVLNAAEEIGRLILRPAATADGSRTGSAGVRVAA